MTKLNKQSKQRGIGQGEKGGAQGGRESIVQEDIFILAVQAAKSSLRKTTSTQETS